MCPLHCCERQFPLEPYGHDAHMLERRHGHGRGQDEAVDGHQGEAGAGHGEDDERP